MTRASDHQWSVESADCRQQSPSTRGRSFLLDLPRPAGSMRQAARRRPGAEVSRRATVGSGAAEEAPRKRQRASWVSASGDGSGDGHTAAGGAVARALHGS